MFPETMLLVTKDLVVLKEVHQVSMDDVFENFGANTCQRYWSVDGRLNFISFLKIGETFAFFQSSSVFPCLSDAESV